MVLLLACSPSPRPGAPVRPANPLFVTPASHDFSSNPPLLERIRLGPHGYFRFVNQEFSQAVCRRYADALSFLPAVNLHGDAHVEQYAVTTIGRGLTDFDDSSTGPGVIDLLRFGVSLRLVAAQKGWQDEGPPSFAEFLRGYRAALDDPAAVAPEPRVVSRVRTSFRSDRDAYLVWTESLMMTMDGAARTRFETDARPYVEAMLAQHPDLPDTFFRLQSIGRLQMGIGSALDEKYLVRVAGPTDDPADDVILEAKEVRAIGGIRCVRSDQNDPFRILVGQSRIAYQPYPYLGYVRIGERVFWIHGWVDNYREVGVSELESARDLRELAYDVGVQLGRGHVAQIASPLDLQLRRAEIAMLETLRPRLERDSEELADLTTRAWERFRRESRP